ncbi:Mitochondrial import inner membrane translocase subunit TIM13, partial [Cucurbita argyrosperma subsp. argyrosperma]
MDSFSSPSSGSSSQFSPNEFRDQLKTQLAQAYAEEFLEVQTQVMLLYLLSSLNLGKFELLTRTFSQTLRVKCFDKCITKPGSSLSGSESSCISRCMERYIEATGIVSRALFKTPH